MSGDPKVISRRFPNLAWAWPEGGRHQLLMAAICPDEDAAFQAIKDWLAATDLNDATFAEHRLLSAITTRFGDRLADIPEYGRLCGLQRLNWTKSRMAVAAATPALQAMVDKGIRLILLKGSCRIALDPAEQKARTSYDLDLLLTPDDFVSAFEVLSANGWQSTRGESVMGLRARISSVRARNFKKGRFGDIDLHQHAYHYANADPDCDQRIFEECGDVDYYGVPAYVPCPEERLAMAIGHGGWDGHAHSDWLVDVARILEREAVDWDKLRLILRARGLAGPAAIALSYLENGVGFPIPHEIGDDLRGTTGRARLQQIPSLFLAKDVAILSKSQKAARGLVEAARRARYSGRDKTEDAPVFRSLVKGCNAAFAVPLTLQHRIDQAAPITPGQYRFVVIAEMDLCPIRRRIEFEINSDRRNICHLQAFQLRKRGGRGQVVFKGRIDLRADDTALCLMALPGKLIEEPGDTAQMRKYGAVPFAVRSIEFERLGEPVRDHAV